MVIRSTWERSAQARRSARRNCAQVCRSPRSRPAAGASIKEIELLVRRLAEARSVGVPPPATRERRGPGRHRTAGCRLLAAQRRSSAMPTFSSCHGSRTCDGAATRWCWNRRAPARCSKFAIRRSRAAIATLSTPQQIKQLRRQDGFPGVELLALLVDCQILFKIDAAGDSGLRPAEGDDNLVLWDFHDLLFHTRSTEGRHANPLGGRLSICGRHSSAAGGAAALARKEDRSARVLSRSIRRRSRRSQSSCANVIRPAASMTSSPITLAELSRFLDSTARVQSKWNSRLDLGDDASIGRARRQAVSVRRRAAMSSSSIWRSTNAKGLPEDSIITTPADTRWCRSASRTHELEALLTAAEFAMDAPAAPQILITIAARFGRISWKYSSIAYALILKDVGVLTANALPDGDRHGARRMRDREHQYRSVREDDGIEFHVEGPVGQFALGRGAKSSDSDLTT